jgi:fibronectin-binding autotransporter adhesin
MKNTIILSIIILISYIPSSFGQTLHINGGFGAPKIEETNNLNALFPSGVVFEGVGGILELTSLTTTEPPPTSETYGGSMSDTNSLGQLNINGTSNTTVILTGNLSYFGGTFINSGSLTGNISPNSPLTLAAAGVAYNLTAAQGDQTVSTLTGVSGSSVNLGGNTLTIGTPGVPNESTTFSGNITGAGGLILKGINTLQLTGTNTYTGGTTINNGSVLQGTTSNLPSQGTYQINRGGSLSISPGETNFFSGTITGRGSVQISGGTTFTLLGESTNYTGGTTVTGPSTTLVIQNDSPPTGSVSLVQGGALSFSSIIPLTFGSPITGDGSVIISETSVTLGAANSYKGGTTINPGSGGLIGTTDSIQGNILNNATFPNGALTFNQSTPGTYPGVISGIGQVIIAGGGTVTFTGANTYTGGTTIANDGSSLIGTTNSLPPGGSIIDNSVLTFNQDFSGTFPGNISGTGSVNIEGDGSVNLTGTNTFTGGTNVNNQSTLVVNGKILNSLIRVDEGAILRGSGTIHFLDLAGVLSPGDPVGTMTITADHFAHSTAAHEIAINSKGKSDQIFVRGRAQLDGILNVLSFQKDRQNLRKKEFTFLRAGKGVTGQFSTLTSNNRLKYSVQYDPTNVKIIVGNLQDFTDAFPPGNTSNAEKTAAYFDTFADNTNLSPDLTSVINGLDTLLATGDPAVVQNAFNQIQPSQYKELGQISFLNNEVVNRTVGSQQQNLRESLWVEKELEAYTGSAALSPQRVASFHHLAKSAKGFKSSSILQTQSQPRHRLGMLALPGSERVGMPANNWIKLGRSSVWVQSYGQIERTKGNHGNAGIRSETGGISLGGDHEVLKNTYLGFLGGMSTTPFHWQQGRGSGRVKSYYGGIYGTWLSQTGFYADGQLIAGGDNYNSHRNIVYPGVNRKARQSHNGGRFSTDLQAGYVWSLKHLTVQPYVDATYMFVNESGFREKGAQSLDFKIKGRMSQFFRGEIGAQVYKTYVLCDALIRPALQLSWVHKRSMGPNSAKVQGGLVGQAQSLSVAGDNRTRNQVAPGLALTVQFAKGLYIIGNVSSQFGGGQKLGDALIRVGYDF